MKDLSFDLFRIVNNTCCIAPDFIYFKILYYEVHQSRLSRSEYKQIKNYEYFCSLSMEMNIFSIFLN